MADVFSERVASLNDGGKTYQQMAADSRFKPSTTWFNQVRWGEITVPPPLALYPDLAKALEVTERRVAEMVAEQWCGVRPDDEVPDHLRNLVQVLRGIDPDDVPAVEAIAELLSEKHTAELMAEAVTKKKVVRVRRRRD